MRDQMNQNKLSNNSELNKYRIKVADVINNYVKEHGYNEVKHKSEIRNILIDKIGSIYVMFQE